MKPVHIVILIVVSIGIAIAVSFYGDTSKYVCFREADSIAVDRPNMKLHVVTTLSKTMPTVYDTTGMEKKVVYRNAKPQDLEKTDKVVLIGYSRNGNFEATEILKKCPSKYEKK